MFSWGVQMNASMRTRCPVNVPFADAEAAWFWTMAVVVARRDGAAVGWRPPEPDRPCDPEDVLLAVDALYRCGSITLAHARVMAAGGERQVPPAMLRERRLWYQAMGLLGWRLQQSGIVA